MKYKLILLTMVLSLIILIINIDEVNSATGDAIGNDTGDISVNGTTTSIGMNTSTAGYAVGQSAGYKDWIYNGAGLNGTIGISNYNYLESSTGWNQSIQYSEATLVFWVQMNTTPVPGDDQFKIGFAQGNVYDWTNGNTWGGFGTCNGYGGGCNDSYFVVGTNFNSGIVTSTTLAVDTNWHKILLFSNDTGYYVYEGYFTVPIGQHIFTNTNDTWRMGFFMATYSVAQRNVIDEIYMCEGKSDCSPEPVAPVTIPIINKSTYNVTSAFYNNTAWSNDTSSFVFSQDTTPTVTFEIDSSGNCSFGIYNLNYTTMIANDSNTKCSTTDTTSMTCTLPSTQALVWNKAGQDLFISCASSETNQNYTSSSQALKIKRLPTVTINYLSETDTIDLSEDGSNYGETSEGWESTGENKTKYITVADASEGNVKYLVVRATRLDAILRFKVNDISVGNISASSGGTGEWDVYAWYIGMYPDITTNNSVEIFAPATNTDDTYIDYIAIADTQDIEDSVTINNSNLILWYTVSNNTYVNSSNGLIYDSTGLIYNSSNLTNYNTITDSGYGNFIFSYKTPDVNSNYTFNVRINFSILPEVWVYGNNTNLSIIIDSTDPIIESVTTDLNTLVGKNYKITVNVTELYDYFVGVTVNDSSFVGLNLTEDPTNIWNGSINYTTPYGKIVTITSVDNASHKDIYSFNVKVSNASLNYTTNPIFNITHSYNDSFYTINDASTTYDIPLKLNLTITGVGDAYIDEYNITHTLLDTPSAIINVTIKYDNGSEDDGRFDPGTTNLHWVSDSWNNTRNSTIIQYNSVIYKLNKSLTLEWENSGVSNVKLFYGSLSNKNTSLYNISVHVTVRTAYDSSSSSLDLYMCDSGINWGAKTCASWTEITSSFYSRTDETYHWGTSNDNYPTIDNDGDGNKDTLFFKIPEITPNGEVMYKIDLDSSNAETSWVVETPTTGGGGGGGGGSSEEDEEEENITTMIPMPSSTGFFGSLGKVGQFFVKIFNGFVKGIKNIIDYVFGSVTRGLDTADAFFIMSIFIVVIIAFLFLSGRKNESSPGGFEI